MNERISDGEFQKLIDYLIQHRDRILPDISMYRKKEPLPFLDGDTFRHFKGSDIVEVTLKIHDPLKDDDDEWIQPINHNKLFFPDYGEWFDVADIRIDGDGENDAKT